MNRRFLLFALIWCMSISYGKAQSNQLHIPLEVQEAYQKGTRSPDGNPGTSYWQNEANYQINVSLEPTTRTIRGEETVTYTNNSPNSLQQLVVRLYPDIFKKGNIRDEAVNPADITEGVNITQLRINDKTINITGPRPAARRSGTNMTVELPAPLAPNSSVTVNIAWNYTIPKETHIREGFYGESSFFVAYWYPQIAVFDDIDGWDRLNYTGQQEFYNDFNDYTVNISVPEGYLVWATGVLQNVNDVLTPAFAKKYENARKSDEIIRIVQREDLKKGKITNKGNTTWRFSAENVPDFAFATSNEYLWDATSVVVDDQTGRRVTVGAAYNPNSKDFYEVARFGRQSVEYLSKQMPGIPFPYPNLTVFNGSGGMEFPMMVNDGSYPALEQAAEVTAHEIAHTYFPFYMGINERKYAWMDEGWAQFLPNGIAFNTGKSMYFPQTYNARVYASFAGKEMDMPLMVPSNLLNGSSYGFASYFRPAVAYEILQDLLGEERFKATLQEYMRRWNGKHPIPYDFFNTFNEVSKENLNWFWKAWFFDKGYPDLGIREVATQDGNSRIVVQRNGSLPVPVHVTIQFADGSQETVHKTAQVWKEGASEYTVEANFGKRIRQIQLGNPSIPDVNPKDNTYMVKEGEARSGN